MRRALVVLIALAAGIALAGCCTVKPATGPTPAMSLAGAVNDGKLVPTVDNFLVIMDSSSSMNDSCQGRKKIYTAKDVVAGITRSLPANYPSGAALRTFGDTLCPFSQKTERIYGLSQYNPEGLMAALDGVKRAAGNSPLALAITEGIQDLSEMDGRLAVIIISDADGQGQEALDAAYAMAKAYPDRLCIYTVLVGDDANGANLLKNIAEATDCGYAFNADSVLTSQGIVNFTSSIFFTQAPVKEVKIVEVVVVIIDTDEDGVPDEEDKCPGTPKGAKVDGHGCWVLDGLLFDLNKAGIKPASLPILDEAYEILARNPNLAYVIRGYTDSTGPAAYNMALSKKRADAVKSYFEDKGIAAGRLETEGLGAADPVADNATAEGRALNRRVTITPKM